ncbi:MAG: 2OG-Fe(II) oxygenase [Ilumatobacter sp.]
MIGRLLDVDRHPISESSYIAECRGRLDRDGALVLHGFAQPEIVGQVVTQCAPLQPRAFFAGSTHNVYLTPPDPGLAVDHPFNRQIESSKGLIADDELSVDSPLRAIYGDESFRSFLCGVLDIDAVYPYADDVSSINVHFASAGQELGWHFDNSSFAVTMLLQPADGGAHFEYVPGVRDADVGDMAFDRVERILDGDEPVRRLEFEAGDLVVFRGRDALHRVTPTEGNTTRLLVVFAYNSEPGVALSASALDTFYGRTG